MYSTLGIHRNRNGLRILKKSSTSRDIVFPWQCFHGANQISRLSTLQTNIPSLCCSMAPRRAATVFIAFPRAPSVICEAHKRPWCRQWTFYRPTAFFCRAHMRRLTVIKFRATPLVCRGVEFCGFSWYFDRKFGVEVTTRFNCSHLRIMSESAVHFIFCFIYTFAFTHYTSENCKL